MQRGDADFHRDCCDTEGDGPPELIVGYLEPLSAVGWASPDAVVALILGVVRREMAVAPLCN